MFCLWMTWVYVQAFGNSTVLRHFLTARLQKVSDKVEALLQYCLVVLVAQFGTKASLRTAGKGGRCDLLAAALARSHSMIAQRVTIRARFSKQIMQTLTDIGTLIVRTPGTCGGRPRIAGTRITVQYIVNEIRAGVTPEEILENKPHLTLGGMALS
jgi:uncharacterized protein (DUF433 family)